jgi:hypothetical protein
VRSLSAWTSCYLVDTCLGAIRNKDLKLILKTPATPF